MSGRKCCAPSGCAGEQCAPYRSILHMVPLSAFSVEDGERPTASDYESLFDSQCRRCDSDIAWKDGLCDICIHLRVYHLIACMQDLHCDAFPLINLGTLSRLGERKGCKFCSTVARMFATARNDRPRDVHPEDPILMLPCVDRLSTKYRRTILLIQMGIPHLIFFTPAEHTLEGFWSMGTERYAKVISQTQGMNCENQNLDRVPRNVRLVWRKVEEWVNECRQEDATTNFHEQSKALSKKSFLPTHFKVMDLEKGCIVNASSTLKYAALSYVWGVKLEDEIETTKDNIELLSVAGCLDRIDLPQTIRDAIDFCRKVQVRYLWVDRLCIVQDDASQKHDQISAMDTIYSSALFTICATAGSNSRHGLPGMGSTSRPFTRANLRLADVEILPIMPNMKECLADGWWFERGWTFQESLLGGKLFLFTEWQLFFRNKDSDFLCEDELTEMDGGWFADVAAVTQSEYEDDQLGSFFWQYASHLRAYSGRKLSYESDTYNAFAGIFRSLYDSLEGYIYGLPDRDFDVAIMWGARPISSLDCPREIHDVVLPTWSWGSLMHWSPEIMMGGSDTIAAVARWARCDREGRLMPIMATNDPTAHLSAYRWNIEVSSSAIAIDPRPYVLAAWPICMEAPVPVLRKLRSPSQSPLIRRWPAYSHFWKEAHSLRIPFGNKAMAAMRAQPGRVLVRTTMSKYRLWAGNTVGASQDFYILDNDGWCLGTCRVPVAIATASSLVPASHPDLGLFDFLALSLRFSRDSEFFDNLRRRVSHEAMERGHDTAVRFQAPPMLSEGVPENAMYDGDGNLLDPSPVLSVMLIAWNEGVAHRIWLGQVSLACWIANKPSHRTVVLE